MSVSSLGVVLGAGPLGPAAEALCPACGESAEIVDRFTLAGAPGPVEHARVVCSAGHRFTPPLDALRFGLVRGRG